MTAPPRSPAAPAPREQTPRFGMTVALAFAGTVVAFMTTLVIPIQNHLPEIFDASRDDTAWVVTITLIANAVFTPIAGRLGDIYGRRRLILILLGALVLGSVVSGLTELLPVMLIGRALQGSSLGVISLSISVLRQNAPAGRLGTSVGIVSGSLGFGGAIGLPVSAAISQWSSWHVLFAVAAGLGVAAIILVVFLVPRDADTRSPGRIDLTGAVWMAIALSSILVGLTRGNVWGWLSPWTIGLIAGGLTLLFLWVRYELRVPDPIVDIRLLVRRPVLLTNLASVFIGFAFFAGEVFYPQLLELPSRTGIGLGLDLFETSLALVPGGIAMMAVAPVAAWTTERFGARMTLAFGAVVMALAYGASLIWRADAWQVAVLYGLVGAGGGLAYATMPVLIMQKTPLSQTAAANGLNSLARSGGMTLAAAVCGLVLAGGVGLEGGVAAPSAQAFDAVTIASIFCSIVAVLVIAIRPRPSGKSARGEIAADTLDNSFDEKHPAIPEPVTGAGRVPPLTEQQARRSRSRTDGE